MSIAKESTASWGWVGPPRFDDFVIVGALGRGGMGQVFLAHDEVLDRPVALKFTASTAPSDSARSRFLREARALARLAHPNVVGVYRVGEVEGRPYIAYELVRGQSLDRVLLPVPWPRVLRIALGVARGLTAAHAAGVLHRDIKPANVMVAASGEVKLLDFGLAKLEGGEPPAAPGLVAGSAVGSADALTSGPTEDLDAAQTASGSRDVTLGEGAQPSSVMGTPAYMPPEIWSREPATARSDLYAFGLLLFELLTGNLPHLGLRAVLTEDATPIKALRPDVPDLLCALIDACLQRQPARRPTSADEVRRALEDLHAVSGLTSVDAELASRDAAPELLSPAGVRAPSDRGPLRPTLLAGSAPEAAPTPSKPPEELPPPRTQYCFSGDVSIAYQVFGEGPIDLVVVMGWVSHVELTWRHPAPAGFFRSLGRFARVITFDKRGTGMSDRAAEAGAFELSLDDIVSVLDATGARDVVLLGVSDGAALAAFFAATHPERVRGVMLFGGAPRMIAAPDYPEGHSAEFMEGAFEEIRTRWGEPVFVEAEAPSLAHDPAFRAWFAEYLRMSSSPGNAIAMLRRSIAWDLRALLASVRAPTLVLSRTHDVMVPIGQARALSAEIPGSRLIELPGADHLPFTGDVARVIAELEAFARALPAWTAPTRSLVTLLVARRDGASEARSADPAPRGARVFGGPDAVCFAFDGAVRATEHALALLDRAANQGESLRIGLHVGDCALAGDARNEPAVAIAAALADRAAAGEALATEEVRMLGGGGRLSFKAAGELALGGVARPVFTAGRG